MELPQSFNLICVCAPHFMLRCESTGADVSEVSRAIGLDSRIGPKFLQVIIMPLFDLKLIHQY
jgi:hypothetical protein